MRTGVPPSMASAPSSRHARIVGETTCNTRERLATRPRLSQNRAASRQRRAAPPASEPARRVARDARGRARTRRQAQRRRHPHSPGARAEPRHGVRNRQQDLVRSLGSVCSGRVRRSACSRTSGPAGDHHGDDRRGRHVRRVRGQVPTGWPTCSVTSGCGASTTWRIFMENNPRMLECRRRSRALRPLLHVHQLVPVARRGGVHRQRLRGAGARVTSAAKREVAVAAPGAVPERRAVADGRRRRADGRSRAYADAVAAYPDRIRSPTSSSARRCSTRRARPGSRRASCGRCPTQHPSEPLAVMEFVPSHVPASAKG